MLGDRGDEIRKYTLAPKLMFVIRGPQLLSHEILLRGKLQRICLTGEMAHLWTLLSVQLCRRLRSSRRRRSVVGRTPLL